MKIVKDLLNKLRKTSRPAYTSGVRYTSDTPLFEYVSSEDSKKKEDNRIVKKPVEVFKEILSETKPFVSLINVDEQIETINKRKDFILKNFDFNPVDEIEALHFLEARKKYLKFQDSFNWPAVTFESAQKLCKKYKLKQTSLSINYKNLPTEAIDEMEAYIQVWEKVREDKPLFVLIVDDGGRETKKDPILLAMSPFGKWYHFLGAWDKEVEYVDDIIYKGK